jgi:vacuolar protein sorting-associated protein 45
MLKKSAIERLAEADEYETVKEVQEYFADYVTVTNMMFTLNLIPPAYSLYNGEPQPGSQPWYVPSFNRSAEGIISVLLSLKKRPAIRYQRNSAMAKKLASEILYVMQQEAALFDFRRTDTPPILMILDRKFDSVTPLLNQWSYQAMVHELIGIKNGRVDLTYVPNIRPEVKEIVLSPVSDPFFKANMHVNLGDLGATIKTYVDEYQLKHKSSMNIESISDMKKFVEDYPEFRKLSGNVTKHVTLVGELSRIIDKEILLEIGELEQSLACFDNHSNDSKVIAQVCILSKISRHC